MYKRACCLVLFSINKFTYKNPTRLLDYNYLNYVVVLKVKIILPKLE